MLIENVKPGNRIEITLRKNNSTAKTVRKSYISQVEAILEENLLLIHMPIAYGKYVKLSKDEPYAFVFFTDAGMLSFDGMVIGYAKQETFHFMKVKLISDGERIQRREFFRFNCVLPIRFSVISYDALESASAVDEDEPGLVPLDINPLEGIVKDIGGGGLRFVSNEDVDESAQLQLTLDLNFEILILMGKILHKQYFPKSVYKYQYRIEFVGILPQERDKIVRYIFNEQSKGIKTRN